MWVGITGLRAQDIWYNHPELEWQTFETEHFLIHFHEGTERSAREAAAVAEKIYGPVTQLYHYEPPNKTHLIIKDVDDVSNGIAYFYDNKIEIWARPLDFDLRGSHRWMQGVITHEFVHIVQMASAMKFTSMVPGAYFQALGYEDEKRPDVLYGYPNVLVSYPYPGVIIPPWFAEGVAQFMYEGANYDYWDSHRDMIVRDRILHGNFLSFAAMNNFGKRGTGNESVYDHGFAFVKYLADRFGPAALEGITRNMSKPMAVSISRAMEKVTGVPGQQLYYQWKGELEEYYAQTTANIRNHGVEGEIILSEGSTNVHPVWHPSARKLAYLSNKASDYFGQTDLYIYDLETQESKRIAGMVESAACWSLDGQTLYYAGRTMPGKTGARWFDLFAYDLGNMKKERLTHDERVTSPIQLGQQQKIAYLTVYDGSSNIRVLDLSTKEMRTITSFTEGEYIHSLTYASADSAILFDMTLNHGREIWKLFLENGVLEQLQGGPGNEYEIFDMRDPSVSGPGLLISTDRAGVFNLYLMNDDSSGYISNVAGGAFMPSMNAEGEIVYSVYSESGYKIAFLADVSILNEELVGTPADLRHDWPGSPQEGPDISLTATPYLETMTHLYVLPRLMMDYGTVKPGVFLYANEVLDNLLLFGGFSLNRLRDWDQFLLFEFRKFRPTLYAEIYAMRRHVNRDFNWYGYEGTNDLRFDLIEGVVGGRMPIGRHRFWLESTFSQYREHIFQRIEDLSGGFSFAYYKGMLLTGRWQFSTRRPEYGGNMFPTKGLELYMELQVERNNLAEDFTISKKYSTPVTIYEKNHTGKLTINFKKYLTLHRGTRFSAAYENTLGIMSNTEIDTFFYFFGGGLPGLRGYTYYDSTTQGTNLMIHSLTFRLPVILEQNIPFLHLILQNASVGFMVQYGDGFNGSWINHQYKTSYGIEFRLNGHSFYAFPFALSLEMHRPADGSLKGYRHYLSLLFDF
ncbi:hypothetical protein ACFL5M_05995 [Candidatus Neomarinimicrobiota bacterium]